MSCRCRCRVCVTSVLASLTGVGYAFSTTSARLRPQIAFLVFFMVIIGGSDSLAGALLGATLLFFAPEASARSSIRATSCFGVYGACDLSAAWLVIIQALCDRRKPATTDTVR